MTNQPNGTGIVRELNNYYSPLQLLLDVLTIIITFIVCAPLSHWISPSSSPAPETPLAFIVRVPAPWDVYFNLAPLLLLLPLFSLHIARGYEHSGSQKFWPMLRTTSCAVLITAGFILCVYLVTPLIKHGSLFLTLFLSALWIFLP